MAPPSTAAINGGACVTTIAARARVDGPASVRSTAVSMLATQQAWTLSTAQLGRGGGGAHVCDTTGLQRKGSAVDGSAESVRSTPERVALGLLRGPRRRRTSRIRAVDGGACGTTIAAMAPPSTAQHLCGRRCCEGPAVEAQHLFGRRRGVWNYDCCEGPTTQHLCDGRRGGGRGTVIAASQRRNGRAVDGAGDLSIGARCRLSMGARRRHRRRSWLSEEA